MSHEQYRNQVQNQLQDLVSGNRPRDPHLCSVSTGRLILEGVVEAIRTYRLHKQEQEQVQRTKGGRMNGRERGDREKDGRQRRHHDRKKGGERRRHQHYHRERSGERHHRHRSRDRSHDNTRRHEHSKGRSRSHDASRHSHRDHSGRDRNKRRSTRDIPDPVTEGLPNKNPRYMMTGGAGPAGSLPSSDQPGSQSRDRSRSRSRPRPLPKDHPPGQAGLSRSPTHTRGPDGMTPFGSLSKRAAGEGFAAHAFKVYRHVKAEHEHGHRERSAIEKAVDGWRGKGGTKGRAGEERKEESSRKERGREDGERRRKDGDRRRREDGGRHDGRRRGNDRPREDNRGSKRIAREEMDCSAAQRPHTPHIPQQTPPNNTAPVQSLSQNALSHPSQELVRRQTPPLPPNSHNNPLAWLPTSDAFVPPSRSVSPPYPDRPGESPTILHMPQSTSTPPPPPLPSPTTSTVSSFHMPPPPAPARQTPPSKAALLDQIQTGRRLRRVASADKKDKSQAASAGRVYDETAHSREVENRERAQERGWSDDGMEDGGSETESERMRKLRLELGAVR